MSNIKVQMSISVDGSAGVYTVPIPGGLPRKLDPDEKAPVFSFDAKDVREAIFKGYLNLISCIVAGNSPTTEKFVSEINNYARKLELYPDDR